MLGVARRCLEMLGSCIKKLVPVQGWEGCVAKVSSAIEHALTAATLSNFFVTLLFENEREEKLLKRDKKRN